MRAATPDEYVRDPVGRYVAGQSYLVWIASPSLAGSAYFGRVDERELAEVARLAGIDERWADPAGYDVVVDCGALVLDGPSFAMFARYLGTTAAITTRLRKLSIVRPAGISGATIAGIFHEDLKLRFRAALFADRGEAFAWLGRADAPEARTRVDAVLEHVRGAPPLLRTLRDELARDAKASLAAIARKLGLSERSLSRRLGELDTSFREEVQRARLRRAEVLLVETDLKLDAIAREIGFRSRAHFSDFFHRATGEPPSEFRARRR